MFSQQTSRQLRNIVLAENVLDSTYVFDRSQEGDVDIIQLRILGYFTLEDGRCIKVLSSTWIWGTEDNGTARIMIFTEKNRFLGDYNLRNRALLPKKMVNGVLIFEVTPENENENIDQQLIITEIDLKPKLPKCIQIEGGERPCFVSV